jgi:hypothetical protein
VRLPRLDARALDEEAKDARDQLIVKPAAGSTATTRC